MLSIVMFGLLALTLFLFCCLIYVLHSSLARVLSNSGGQLIEQSDIQRDQILVEQKRINLMDAAQLAESQNVNPPPYQIYIFAPDPVDLHSDIVYASTLRWCKLHMNMMDDAQPDLRPGLHGCEHQKSLPCMVFWSRQSERQPRVVELARRLYFDLDEDSRVFNLIFCAKLPDYMFFHDMLVHHFEDGSTRAYLNSRFKGVTDVLLELHKEEAVQIAHLLRYWLRSASTSVIEVPELVAPDLNPAAADLTPFFHPIGIRARPSFEPCWLGDATGRGAEPRSSSSDPPRCIAGSLSLA